MFRDRRNAALWWCALLIGLGGGWAIPRYPQVGVALLVLGSAVGSWLLLHVWVHSLSPTWDQTLSGLFIGAWLCVLGIAVSMIGDVPPPLTYSLVEMDLREGDAPDSMRYRLMAINKGQVDVDDLAMTVEFPNDLLASPTVVTERRSANARARADYVSFLKQMSPGSPVEESPGFNNVAVFDIERLLPDGSVEFEIRTKDFEAPYCHAWDGPLEVCHIWQSWAQFDQRCASTGWYGQIRVRRRHKYYGRDVNDSEVIPLIDSVSRNRELAGTGRPWSQERCIHGPVWRVEDLKPGEKIGVRMSPAD